MSAEAPLPNRRPIDLNTAPADALTSVVGIGGVLAERIVAYRRDHGPFASLSQLTNVVGIGPGVLRRIRDQLTVGEGVPATSDVSRPPDQEPPEGGQALVEPIEREEPEQVAQPPLQEVVGREPEPEAAESVEQAGEAIEPTPVEREEAAAEPSPEEEAPPEEERQPEAELPPPAAEVVPTKVEEAAAEPGVEIEEPVAEKEAVEERVQVERPPRPKPVPARAALWHDLWLVLLGGLAGVALTVIATVIWSGTVDFAPRSEMQALSGNLDTMQSNQEQAGERIVELEARVGDLQKLTGRVSGLEDALDEAERELAEAQDRLVQTQDSVHKLKEALTSEIASLRSSVTHELERQGQRLDETEDALSELTASLKELEDAFELVEGRVRRFDTFFASLRDLLIDMQGPSQPAKAGPAAKPTATPIAKGK